MAEQEGKVRGVVDMVFLLDVTGSMQPCIDALKLNIMTFIDSLTTKDPQNPSPVKDWRARVVGFRDFEVDAEPYVDNPFVRERGELKNQLSRLVAQGGGDEPESLLDALYRVAMMGQTDKGSQTEDPNKWRYRHSAARVVIVFSDATYKPRMALPEAKGGTFEDVKNAVHGNRIILSIFTPDLDCYNELSSLDKSEWEAIDLAGKNPQQALADFTSNHESFRETLRQLAKSVSKSADTPEL